MFIMDEQKYGDVLQDRVRQNLKKYWYYKLQVPILYFQ
jgi:hypothetical protein